MKKVFFIIAFALCSIAANSQVKVGFPFGNADFETGLTAADSVQTLTNFKTILFYQDSTNTKIKTTTKSILKKGSVLTVTYTNTGAYATPSIYFTEGEMESSWDTISSIGVGKRMVLDYLWNGTNWYLTNKIAY